jgi:hypothetical protein
MDVRGSHEAGWIAVGSKILPAARKGDFLNLYTGAKFAHDGRFATLHDPDVQLARERELVPSLGALVPFVRPAFYALLLAPLAALPYGAAFYAWLIAQISLLMGCWTWGWRRFGPDALVFAALALPAPLGIASGQDCVLMLVCLIAAFEFAEHDRPAAAGVALALMLFKFHLVLLWPIALLLQRRWRMLAGYAAMAAAEVLTCVALGGWGGILSYGALLRNKSIDYLSPSPELMISQQGLLANLGIESPAAAIALTAAVLLVFLWSVRGAPLWRLFTITAVASEFVVPHVYGYDATLLLLPLWLTIFHSTRPASRIAAVLLASPIPFGFSLAGKPWAAVSSISMLLFFVLVATERTKQLAPGELADRDELPDRSTPHPVQASI